MTQSVFAGTNSGQGSTHRAVRSERRGWSFGRFWALALLLGAALLCSGQSATAATPLGNCSSESGLTGRGDIVFCEGWESADWWRNGYLKTASTSAPGAAVSADVANTQVVTSGCVSGSCLRVEMKQYQSGALAVHWPLKAAGLQPEELHLRYYLKLGENFDPALCSPDGKPAGSGGKFPGLADVDNYPEEQCGNGGAFADGKNCWSMRSMFRDCNMGEATQSFACTTKPGAKTRFGSYHYYYGQHGYENAGFWDNIEWGQGYYSAPFGSCSTADDVGGCGKGDGGVMLNGRWYLVEIYVKMNTPGKADGVVRGWMDGVLSYEKTNMIWRLVGHDNLHVRTVWLNIHAGGEFVGLCTASYVMLDQLVVATGGRVGPFGGRSVDSSPPAAPSSLRVR